MADPRFKNGKYTGFDPLEHHRRDWLDQCHPASHGWQFHSWSERRHQWIYTLDGIMLSYFPDHGWIADVGFEKDVLIFPDGNPMAEITRRSREAHCLLWLLRLMFRVVV